MLTPGHVFSSLAISSTSSGWAMRAILAPGRRARCSVQAEHHVLDLGIVLQGIGGEVLAIAGLLEAAVRHLGHERQGIVPPNRPELELLAQTQRAPEAARPHPRPQRMS